MKHWTSPRSPGRKVVIATAGAALALTTTAVGPGTAAAAPVGSTTGTSALGRTCPPAAAAVSFSDSLDKLTVDGGTIGGLSSLAYDLSDDNNSPTQFTRVLNLVAILP